MKSKFFFFGTVLFLVSLFVFFSLVSPRFVGFVTKPNSMVAVKQVERRNSTANVVRVADTGVKVNVVENVLV